MKTYFLIPIFLIINFFNVFAQKEDEIIGKKVESSQLLRIQKDEQYLEATFILNEANAKLDITNAKSYYFSSDEFEIKFAIIDPKNNYDYKTFVYANMKGESYTYFEDKNTLFKETNAPKLNEKTAKGLFGFCFWTNWEIIPNYKECLYNWWCGKKNNRRATYHYEQKIKYCYSHGSYYIRKVINRRVKDYCGC